MAIILFLTGLICIGLLFGISYKTYQKIDAVDQKMASVIKPVKQKQKALKEDIELYTAKIEKKQAADNICSSVHRQKKLSKTIPESMNMPLKQRTLKTLPNLLFSARLTEKVLTTLLPMVIL